MVRIVHHRTVMSFWNHLQIARILQTFAQIWHKFAKNLHTFCTQFSHFCQRGATGKRTKFMKYFIQEPHCNFTEDCLGEAEVSAATRGFAETVWCKIALGLRVNYFINFVLFPVAIFTYVLYGLVLTQKSLFVPKLFNLLVSYRFMMLEWLLVAGNR